MASLEHSDGFQYYVARDGVLKTLPELKDGDVLHLQERSCRVMTKDGLCMEHFKSTGALANHIKLDHPTFKRAPAEKTGNPSKKRRNDARVFYAEAKEAHIAARPEQALPVNELVQNLMATPSQPAKDPLRIQFPLYKRSNKKQGIKKGKPNWGQAEKLIKSKGLGSIPCEGCKEQSEDGHCIWDEERGCQSFGFFSAIYEDDESDEHNGQEE